MKKLFLSFIAFCLFISLNAHDGCMTFFPNNPGAMLVHKTYDAEGTLLRTMTYKIDNSYDYLMGEDLQIRFVMTDSGDNIIDQGNLDATCNDGTFYLKMENRTLSPDIIDILSSDTELVSDFLDYPNTFDDGFPFEGHFKMTGGEFTIQSKADKKEFVRVHVSDRQYVGNEKVTTPAKTFHASKVTFNFEVTKDKKTTNYKGIEWYAVNAGIVRTETRDTNNNLINYTELTTLVDN